MNKINATFVSIWDGGVEIRTNCTIDVSTNTVYDIETSNVQGIKTLDKEFVELPDGNKITNFTIDGQDDENLSPEQI
jgi:hypothetical protein